MKQKMKLGTITAVVIVGLMIGSGFTVAIRTTPSFSDNETVIKSSTEPEVQTTPSFGGTAQKLSAEPISFTLKSVDISAPQFALQAKKLTNIRQVMNDEGVVIVGKGVTDSKKISGNNAEATGASSSELFRYEQFPAIADDSAGNIILAYRLINDTYPATRPVVTFQGSNNYGIGLGTPFVAQYAAGYPGGGAIRWDQPSLAYAGRNETGVNRWYGFCTEKDNPATVGTGWNESGRISVSRILTNTTTSINSTVFRYRPWFGFMAGMGDGTFKGISSPSIASNDGLHFLRNQTHWIFRPDGTHQPYDQGGGGGEPFGIIAYTVGIDTSSPTVPYEAHIGVANEIFPLPVHWPVPTEKGVNAYMVTYSWIPPAGNVTTTSTYIDQKNKWGYAAFDPADGSPRQRSGMYMWVDDMYKVMVGFSNNQPNDLETLANLTLTAWIYTPQAVQYDMCKPSIAAYDGAVVIVQELNNNTDPSKNYLELMYNNLYNGSTWRSDTEPYQGLVVSGIWYNTNGAKFRNPKVHHFEGRTFFMTVEFDGSTATPPSSQDLLLAVTYDGGATWSGSPNNITFWYLNGPATGPVIAKETTTTSDNMAAWTNIVNPSSTQIIYPYLTSIITGTVWEDEPIPAAGATVDVYNKDRTTWNVNGYAPRLGPVTCDANGVFRKKVLGVFEVSDGDNLMIIGSKLSTKQVGFCNAQFDPLDFVNSLNAPIILNQVYQDLPGCPFYWAYDIENDRKTDTGAAVAQMILNYIWWDKTISPKVVPLKFADQNALKMAFDTNGNGKIDGQEMMDGLNRNLQPPGMSKYGYWFNLYTDASSTAQLGRLAIWLQYNVSFFKPGVWPAPGHVGSVPEAVPFYGGYNNWTVVRGIYTDTSAWYSDVNGWHIRPGPITVKGVWVNDPYSDNQSTGNPGYYGLPGKTYMTTATFLERYLPISGKYVAVVDPVPGFDQNTDIGAPAIVGVEKARFTPAFAKLAANSHGRMDKAIGAVAQQAVADILRNNIQDFNLAGLFEHSIIGKVVKMPFGYRVTLKALSCDTIVDLDRLGTLLSFTNV